jgi:hypothetical protein
MPWSFTKQQRATHAIVLLNRRLKLVPRSYRTTAGAVVALPAAALDGNGFPGPAVVLLQQKFLFPLPARGRCIPYNRGHQEQ